MPRLIFLSLLIIPAMAFAEGWGGDNSDCDSNLQAPPNVSEYDQQGRRIVPELPPLQNQPGREWSPAAPAFSPEIEQQEQQQQ